MSRSVLDAVLGKLGDAANSGAAGARSTVSPSLCPLDSESFLNGPSATVSDAQTRQTALQLRTQCCLVHSAASASCGCYSRLSSLAPRSCPMSGDLREGPIRAGGHSARHRAGALTLLFQRSLGAGTRSGSSPLHHGQGSSQWSFSRDCLSLLRCLPRSGPCFPHVLGCRGVQMLRSRRLSDARPGLGWISRMCASRDPAPAVSMARRRWEDEARRAFAV